MSNKRLDRLFPPRNSHSEASHTTLDRGLPRERLLILMAEVSRVKSTAKEYTKDANVIDRSTSYPHPSMQPFHNHPRHLYRFLIWGPQVRILSGTPQSGFQHPRYRRWIRHIIKSPKLDVVDIATLLTQRLNCERKEIDSDGSIFHSTEEPFVWPSWIMGLR